ncbi:type VI secretion system contractile sheath large subunit [Pseudoalteromonas sp. 2CM37A]|uniref:type VI secretion system contractile sheath large subunit n=1 Tax=Pseudoalteromonas sp. 2CM37A TaxID=2929853 RepID=UPI0020BFF5D4|nr:type VI secretion system contractile sheath large subunit [Pseudoalteromonas sp. 2CM37A]MCK8116795.1 type VI secretion system contractile sheath large subunit [Pseudoalteromonas sp. 2CM37A]
MNHEEFSFISQGAAFHNEGHSRISDNEALLDRFLNEKNLNKALLLWLEGSSDSPISWAKESLAPYFQRVVVELDRLITEQINTIIHNTDFQKLEASWRNLKWLLVQTEQQDKENKVKIKVLNCDWGTLSKDVNKAIDFDQSSFFQLIYQSEFDRAGGEPFGVIIGDYEVSNSASGGAFYNDIDTIKEISRTAAAAFSPFICSVSASFFGADSFSDLGYYSDLFNQFEQKEYVKWQSFREMEESRFIGLTLPHVLVRPPYSNDGKRHEDFYFKEHIKDPETDMLWGNAAFQFVSTIIRAYCDSGWFGQIRGIEPGKVSKGLVTGLAKDSFANDTYQKEAKPPLDLLVTSKLEKQFSELGFIPASSVTNTEHIVFYSNASAQKAKYYDSSAATINARLSAMLQYILCVSRFAHYLKLMARDKVGSYYNSRECEQDLQKWINNYTAAPDSSSEYMRSKYPLSNAKIKVSENKANPGHYFSVLQLQPHFQLDQMVSSIKLITELSPHHQIKE